MTGRDRGGSEWVMIGFVALVVVIFLVFGRQIADRVDLDGIVCTGTECQFDPQEGTAP